MVIARAAKHLNIKLLVYLGRPVVASGFDTSFFTVRAPRIRPGATLFSRPVKANRNSGTQGMCNVLADECLFLPTMDVAINFLRITHERIMTSKERIVGTSRAPFHTTPKFR
jgi:hypothetical protein